MPNSEITFKCAEKLCILVRLTTIWPLGAQKNDDILTSVWESRTSCLFCTHAHVDVVSVWDSANHFSGMTALATLGVNVSPWNNVIKNILKTLFGFRETIMSGFRKTFWSYRWAFVRYYLLFYPKYISNHREPLRCYFLSYPLCIYDSRSGRRYHMPKDIPRVLIRFTNSKMVDDAALVMYQYTCVHKWIIMPMCMSGDAHWSSRSLSVSGKFTSDVEMLEKRFNKAFINISAFTQKK